MLYTRNSRFCKTCNRPEASVPSGGQKFLLFFLFLLFVLPGVIYFFVGKGTTCHICGLKIKKDHTIKDKMMDAKEANEANRAEAN